MRRAPVIARKGGWSPRIDFLETARYYLLKVELAGVRRDEFRVSYNAERHTLVLRGHRHESVMSAEDKCSAHILEIDYGEFGREIPLPDTPISLDDVRSQVRGGMLYVVLPKASETRVTVVIEETITITNL